MLVPDQEQAMRDIRRVLRPGGRCAYATWGPSDRNPYWTLNTAVAGPVAELGDSPRKKSAS